MRFGSATIVGDDTGAIIIGMGFYWSWFDAAVIGVCLHYPAYVLTSAELNTMLVLLFSALVLGAATAFPMRFNELSRTTCFIVAVTGTGVLGSACTFLFSTYRSVPFLIASVILAGFYTSAMMLLWGRYLIVRGARSTTVRISGVFAFAGILNVLMYALIPEMRIIMTLLLPVISCGVFLWYLRRWGDSLSRRMDDGTELADIAMAVSAPLERNGKEWFGVDVRFAIGIVIFSFAMGFTQHVNIYSGLAVPPGYILLVFISRTITGAIYFIGAGLLGWKPYRITMASVVILYAGFLLLLPLTTVPALVIPALILITVGFAGFDVFLWVVLSEIAYYSSGTSTRILAFGVFCSRLSLGAGYLFGSLTLGTGSDYAMLIVISQILSLLFAIALLLVFTDSGGVWTMMKYGTSFSETSNDINRLLSSARRLAVDYGLTEREQEIVVLLAQGRSYMDLAEYFHISLNTVKTHVSHIYSKMNIHSKQELTDLLEPTID